MAFIAYCYRWPCRSTTSSTTSTAIHNHYLAYIPTHYLHRNIQQHIRMYANNITVCCIHLTNYLHFLSHSSHTKGQRHPLGPRFPWQYFTDGDDSRSSLSWLTPLSCVSNSVEYNILQYVAKYNVWQICVKYVCFWHTAVFVFVQIFSEFSVCMCVLPF